MSRLIGIAGGSGSVKSTLAYSLQDRLPNLIEVVHFDDYQKSSEQIHYFNNMRNWDCPEAIDFDKLLSDLDLLKSGKDVEIMTKSERHNPRYIKDWKRVSYTMRAKELIIIEGYMSLTDERVRELYDLTIFLDLCFEERIKRRTKFISSDYTEKVLMPMHEMYVEPTKELADIVIKMEEHNAEEAKEQALALFQARGFL